LWFIVVTLIVFVRLFVNGFLTVFSGTSSNKLPMLVQQPLDALTYDNNEGMWMLQHMADSASVDIDDSDFKEEEEEEVDDEQQQMRGK
jgi:hypothetical protein